MMDPAKLKSILKVKQSELHSQTLALMAARQKVQMLKEAQAGARNAASRFGSDLSSISELQAAARWQYAQIAKVAELEHEIEFAEREHSILEKSLRVAFGEKQAVEKLLEHEADETSAKRK